MDLYDFLGKQVHIKDTDGNEFEVFIETWDKHYDGDDEIQTICFTKDGVYFALDNRDIASIEIIETAK